MFIHSHPESHTPIPGCAPQMVSKINLLAAAGKLALDKLDCKSPSSYYAPMMNEEPWELPLVNEGEGPPISLADIQRAREEDQDHPL